MLVREEVCKEFKGILDALIQIIINKYGTTSLSSEDCGIVYDGCIYALLEYAIGVCVVSKVTRESFSSAVKVLWDIMEKQKKTMDNRVLS